ncbi:efflux RND transporter periplasmic adaptor subunit [Marinimicrobium sp. ABcell2]|uniref:efflux RND transporter periplasmic adaptor subunit n=1 Tax=Marinimicrobium sp. ABcell2 TaxID=3069751 RepID=UPI0027B6CB45|nr:HlyD family efflux transporter periplasmic adaptor subunit [Marinimicrobium sp. ABcell2]MDQ2077744.1 efflux RND transporter periplasmic adaptor subunit [Marinimicrobium sp. ABcell2]
MTDSTRIQDTAHQDSALPPTTRRRRVGLALAAGALVLAGLIYGFTSLTETLAADRVVDISSLRLAIVERGDLVREVTAQGRIVVANSPTLFSPEQGTVVLKVKPGDSVSEGQLLAVIDSPELREALARERAALTRLQVDLARQKIELDQLRLQQQQTLAMAEVQLKAMHREKRRADRSYQLKLISELDYEEMADNLERAELEYEQARQNLSLSNDSTEFYDQSLKLQSESQQMIIQALERRVKELEILSPVEGMVGNIEVNQKQAVAPYQPLITVVDLTTYEIEAQVAEGLSGELAPMMDAHIRLSGQDHPGVVTAISPEVVQGQVTARIRFAGEPPANLRQNQRLTARILLENRSDTLMVRRGPHFDNFRGYVFKLEGHKGHKTPVTLGGRSLSHIEIIDGLAEGDTIIVSALNIEPNENNILVSN